MQVAGAEVVIQPQRVPELVKDQVVESLLHQAVHLQTIRCAQAQGRPTKEQPVLQTIPRRTEMRTAKETLRLLRLILNGTEQTRL